MIYSTQLVSIAQTIKTFLALHVLCISENCIEIKIKVNFYFHTFLGFPKGFMKAFKTFIKPFDAPQRSVKTKINFIFFLRPRLGREELNEQFYYSINHTSIDIFQLDMLNDFLLFIIPLKVFQSK